jgi:hypothetical protein
MYKPLLTLKGYKKSMEHSLLLLKRKSSFFILFAFVFCLASKTIIAQNNIPEKEAKQFKQMFNTCFNEQQIKDAKYDNLIDQYYASKNISKPKVVQKLKSVMFPVFSNTHSTQERIWYANYILKYFSQSQSYPTEIISQYINQELLKK